LPDVPRGCHISLDWLPGKEGIEMAQYYIEKNPKIKLVVVDTLKMVRMKEKNNKNVYDIDYDDVLPWRKFSQKNNISVVMIHHNRKPTSHIVDDPLEMISGSYGLSGGVDNVMVLSTNNKDKVSFLYVKGNDIEQQEYALSFSQKRWTYEGLADDFVSSEKEGQVLELFEDGEIITPKEVKDKLQISYDYAKKLVKRLLDKNLITKTSRGKYKRGGV